jgi:hypothetical protein
MNENEPDWLLFCVQTPLGCEIRLSANYWNVIAQIKHPIMARRELEVRETLVQPDQIRRSRNDPQVYLFYKLKQEQRWLCAVVKRLNGDGFLITSYPTDAIKEGEIVWQK